MTNPLTKLWRKTPFSNGDNPLVAVIPLTGMIGVSSPGSRRVLNYERMEKSIEAAFKPDNLTAVALAINSPGGSPVQSKLIFGAIRRLAEEKQVPVFAFIEDVGASGGYMLAVAADEIYADDSSIVGSIGVISGGFGFPDVLEKVGVERRIYTAGTSKSQLDPFSPEKPEDVGHLQSILDSTHASFIELVKQRRGSKVKTDHEDIFSGSFWTAAGAKERGLIDGVAHMTDFLKNRFGKDVVVKKFARQYSSFFARITGAQLRAGTAPLNGESPALVDPEAVVETLKEREIWSRYGL